MIKKFKEMRLNWSQLDASGIRLLVASGFVISVGFFAIAFVIAQLFCLLYWWMTGVSLSWFAVFVSNLVTALATRLGLIAFSKLSIGR